MSGTLIYSFFVVISVVGGHCLALHAHRVLRFLETLSLRQWLNNHVSSHHPSKVNFCTALRIYRKFHTNTDQPSTLRPHLPWPANSTQFRHVIVRCDLHLARQHLSVLIR